MAVVYVTGHRRPDLDSIGSAIAYAELKQRLDPENEYRAVRLGEVNAQTSWALERAGLAAPPLLPHIRLRASDVMGPCNVTARLDDPVRDVGQTMATHGLDLVPILGEDGALAGVVTDHELARMYIRESRGASTFEDRPVTIEAIVSVLDGALMRGEPERQITGRLLVAATDADAVRDLITPGDLIVVGNRPDVQRLALESGVAVLVMSHGIELDEDLLAVAAERDAAVIVSPLDSYVTARMMQLAVPCGAVMNRDPLTLSPEDFAADVTEEVKETGVRAAVVVNAEGCPVGIVTRSDLVRPRARRVVLVDHAEQAQSVPGIDEAEIIEILDHHHIGSIETHVPVKATFDPVGSTATLVVERFRREGREPKPATATMLLAALLSDTVILTSPTTTDRDHRVAGYLKELLGIEPADFGAEMFRAASELEGVPAAELVDRDAKAYTGASGRPFWIAQVEVVGPKLLERRDELLEALDAVRAERGAALSALMVTDITEQSTELLLAGDMRAAERAFDAEVRDGVVRLEGVMSRKKQVAPPLLATV